MGRSPGKGHGYPLHYSCMENPDGWRRLKSESEIRSVLSDSLRPQGLYSPWNSPGQNTGVGSCSLPQGVFSTQESNPGLLHCKKILYHLSHQGSPENKESACNVGDLDSIPGLGSFPGEGNSYPLQYSCLENSRDR